MSNESLSKNPAESIAVLLAQNLESDDFVPFPPVKTEAVSPNGQYVLTVESLDGWKTKYAVARLTRRTASGSHQVWEKPLPQEYGPRYALVGDEGQVVLFDESINVSSQYAVMLINENKNIQLSHSFDAVAKVLGVKTSAIVEQAKGGWWISAKPVLDKTGAAAVVGTAGKHLSVDLSTGRLSVLD